MPRIFDILVPLNKRFHDTMARVKLSKTTSLLKYIPSHPPDNLWTTKVENCTWNLLDFNPKQRGKRSVEAGVRLGVIKTTSIHVVYWSSLCEGGIDFGVVSSDFGSFVCHDEWGNMHSERWGQGEIVPECNLHIPCITLSSRVAISVLKKQSECSLITIDSRLQSKFWLFQHPTISGLLRWRLGNRWIVKIVRNQRGIECDY